MPRPDYEGFIADITREVVREQTPVKLRQIRTMFYELLTKGITADLIFNNLVREFLKPASGNNRGGGAVAEAIKPHVMRYAVIFEGRCTERAKVIIHLEAFLARVMALIRQQASG